MAEDDGVVAVSFWAAVMKRALTIDHLTADQMIASVGILGPLRAGYGRPQSIYVRTGTLTRVLAVRAGFWVAVSDGRRSHDAKQDQDLFLTHYSTYYSPAGTSSSKCCFLTPTSRVIGAP
jgi:hypothetical protein